MTAVMTTPVARAIVPATRLTPDCAGASPGTTWTRCGRTITSTAPAWAAGAWMLRGPTCTEVPAAIPASRLVRPTKAATKGVAGRS